MFEYPEICCSGAAGASVEVVGSVGPKALCTLSCPSALSLCHRKPVLPELCRPVLQSLPLIRHVWGDAYVMHVSFSESHLGTGTATNFWSCLCSCENAGDCKPCQPSLETRLVADGSVPVGRPQGQYSRIWTPLHTSPIIMHHGSFSYVTRQSRLLS